MMKFLSFIFIVLVAVSCSHDDANEIKKIQPEIQIKIDGVKKGIGLYVIDSCEYIGHLTEYDAVDTEWLSHKGNCRFCTYRARLFYSILLKKPISEFSPPIQTVENDVSIGGNPKNTNY